MIEITVDTRRATVTNRELLTSGSVGIPVSFTLSEDWDGLIKTACFRNGDNDETQIDIALTDTNECALPHENCAEEFIDETVFAGIYGADYDGNIVIPTVWASLGALKQGVKPGNASGSEPTPDMWAQIQAIAMSAGAENAEAAAQSAEAASGSADDAAASATEAAGYATAASGSVDEASGYATAASGSASDAADSATAAAVSAGDASTAQTAAETAQTAAETAQSLAETAQAAAEAAQAFLENASATATTLEPGSSATASYEDGVFIFGIPEGLKGDKGDKGDTGATGATGQAGADAVVYQLELSSDVIKYRPGETDKLFPTSLTVNAYKVVGNTKSAFTPDEFDLDFYEVEGTSGTGDSMMISASSYTFDLTLFEDVTDLWAGVASIYSGSTKLASAPITVIKEGSTADDVSYDSTEAYDDGTVGKELTTINSALSSLSSVTEIIDTASGAIASFPDGSGLPMRSLVAQIEPQQDLHGYDAPWAAGAGKNLLNLDFTNDSGTVAGMTFTHGESYITLKGTASGTSYATFNLRTPIPADLNTDYTYSLTISGTCPGGLYGIEFNNGSTLVQRFRCNTTDATSKTLQIPSAFDNVTFTLEGLTSGLVFDCEIKIQFEKGSTKTTWQTYSNECPITGWTGLSGKRDGKNLLDPSTLELGGIDANTGADISVQTRVRTGFIFVQSGTYIVSNESNCTMASFVYDANGNFVSSNTTWQNPKIVTVTKPSKLRFLFRVGASTVMTVADVVNPQVEVGSTASTYEAYTGEAISVTWQTEAGTVYGGNVDVVTGVLTVDREIVPWASLNWSRNTSGTYPTFNATRAKYVSDATKVVILSSCYIGIPAINGATFRGSDYNGCINYTNSGNLMIQDNRYDNVTDFVNYISTQQLLMYLAEPVVYQLTPQQIETLIGNNTVFVDTGAVEVTYQASIKGYIDKVLAS